MGWLSPPGPLSRFPQKACPEQGRRVGGEGQFCVIRLRVWRVQSTDYTGARGQLATAQAPGEKARAEETEQAQEPAGSPGESQARSAGVYVRCTHHVTWRQIHSRQCSLSQFCLDGLGKRQYNRALHNRGGGKNHTEKHAILSVLAYSSPDLSPLWGAAPMKLVENLIYAKSPLYVSTSIDCQSG